MPVASATMVNDTPPLEIPTKASPVRSRRRQLIGGGIALVVIVGHFFFVLPRIADYRDVWGVVKTLTWQGLLALAVASIVNLLTYAPPWQAALPGLRFRQAFVVTQASTASTYVAPGGAAPGMAVSFAMLRGWGFSGRPVALAVTITGVWNQLVIFGFPAIALGLLTIGGRRQPAAADDGARRARRCWEASSSGSSSASGAHSWHGRSATWLRGSCRG